MGGSSGYNRPMSSPPQSRLQALGGQGGMDRTSRYADMMYGNPMQSQQPAQQPQPAAPFMLSGMPGGANWQQALGPQSQQQAPSPMPSFMRNLGQPAPTRNNFQPGVGGGKGGRTAPNRGMGAEAEMASRAPREMQPFMMDVAGRAQQQSAPGKGGGAPAPRPAPSALGKGGGLRPAAPFGASKMPTSNLGGPGGFHIGGGMGDPNSHMYAGGPVGYAPGGQIVPTYSSPYGPMNNAISGVQQGQVQDQYGGYTGP